MPSSISNSDYAREGLDRYARQTAADRPAVAQPVPTRPIPEQPWRRILLGAIVLVALLVASWEGYWRAHGATPDVANSYGLWAIQRRRIDAGEGSATVLLGASRVYYDIELPVWQKLEGHRPIQLAFEGTSPLVYVEDLAADPDFKGRALIGVEPDLFFSGYGYHDGGTRYLHKESPSQRIGQWLSMHLLEPYLAFNDPDRALQAVLARQPWPARRGKRWQLNVRKLGVHEADRNSYLWAKVDTDPDYRALARRIWRDSFEASDDDPSPQAARQIQSEQIARMAKAVATLRARGVQVIFVRLPSSGEYLAYENREFPRASSWDVLLAAAHAPGIHFEDYPELQGYWLPEWSHMTRSEAERFTAALYNIIARDFWRPRTGSAGDVTGLLPR